MSKIEKKDRPKGKQPKGPGGFETIADFSWTDGGTLPPKPIRGGGARGKTKTVIENTKPEL